MWHVRDSGMSMVGKMTKYVGTAIHKSIVVLFLPCLVTFFFEIPSLHASSFCTCFIVTCFCLGGEGERKVYL